MDDEDFELSGPVKKHASKPAPKTPRVPRPPPVVEAVARPVPRKANDGYSDAHAATAKSLKDLQTLRAPHQREARLRALARNNRLVAGLLEERDELRARLNLRESGS